MLQQLRMQRLLDLRAQALKKKAEAKKSMEKGDLKTYYENLNAAKKLKEEFSETLSMEV
jgi:hypothetical protein